MTDKIDIRQEMHRVIGHLRRGEWIMAYEWVLKMSKQLDDDYYNNPANFKKNKDDRRTT